MENQIILTSSEQEMIKLKREQDALLLKQKEIESKIEQEKEIQSALHNIELLEKEDQKQINAAELFLADFDNDWKISIREIPTKKEIKEYTNLLDPKSNNWEQKVVWSKEYLNKEAFIVSKDGKYKIRIEKHYSKDSFGYNRKFTGYEMRVEGPGFSYGGHSYKKASTIQKKIDTEQEKQENKKKQLTKRQQALEKVLNTLKNKYLDATITTKTDYEGYGGYFNRRYYSHVEFDVVTIEFVNKIKITYRVFDDCSLSRREIFFNVNDSYELMDKLSKI